MKTLIAMPTLILVAALFAMAAVPVSAGPVKGLAGHVASGNATIQNGKVELGADFVFDGGPDVYVAVKSGNGLHLLGKLDSNTGAQSYALPDGSDEADFGEIILWCKQFSVALASWPVPK